MEIGDITNNSKLLKGAHDFHELNKLCIQNMNEPLCIVKITLRIIESKYY